MCEVYLRNFMREIYMYMCRDMYNFAKDIHVYKYIKTYVSVWVSLSLSLSEMDYFSGYVSSQEFLKILFIPWGFLTSYISSKFIRLVLY